MYEEQNQINLHQFTGLVERRPQYHPQCRGRLLCILWTAKYGPCGQDNFKLLWANFRLTIQDAGVQGLQPSHFMEFKNVIRRGVSNTLIRFVWTFSLGGRFNC